MSEARNPPSLAPALPTPPRPVLRKRLWLAAKLLVVAGAFTYILTRQPWPELAAALARIAPLSFAAAVLVLVAVIVVATWRWRCLMQAYGAISLPSFPSLLRVYFVGLFYNTYLPGAVGGDVLRGVLVRRAFPDGGATAGVAIVFVERAVGVLALLGVSALAALYSANPELQRYMPYCLLGIAGVAGVVTASAFGRRLARYAPLRIAAILRNLPELQRLWPVVLACLLSFVSQGLLACCAHLLVSSIYPEAEILASLIAMPLAGAAAFFPLSVAGAGARDAMLVTMFAMLGVPAAAGTATALALLLVTLLVAGIGGVLQLLAPLAPPEADAPPPAPRTP